MLQLTNQTPFRATATAFPDAHGVDALHVIVKATFAVGGDGVSLGIAEEQLPVRAADEYHGEPDASSLRYAADVHLPKPGTDVALVGQAWTAASPRRDTVDVLFSVAERSKVVRVFGDRVWRAGALGASSSPPVPFESMPLVWERAFGGVHAVDPDRGIALAEERNPVGRGFCGKGRAREMAGRPLPNLEDPRRPIRGIGDRSDPQCFGFVAPAWLPRRSFAGTYDEAWERRRAPYLPEDFDPRFFQAAHPDLVFDRHLEGGEPVQAVNASASGPQRFALPVCDLDVAVTIARDARAVPMRLETVLLEPDDARLSLLWRGSASCDKKLLRVERVDVGLRRLEIDGRAA